MNENNRATLPLKQILFIAIPAIVLVIGFVYFVFLRPSDSDYQTLASATDDLRRAQASINESTGKIQATPQISDALVSTLETQINKYTTALKLLSTSNTVSKDAKLRSAYDGGKSDLHKYGQSAHDLVSSLQSYRGTLKKCTELVNNLSNITKVSDFDDRAATCEDAITDAKSAPYTAFNEQFLTAYLAQADLLVNAYRQKIAQAQSKATTLSYADVIAINEKILLLRKNTLALTPSPNISNTLQILTTTINSQKSTFIR